MQYLFKTRTLILNYCRMRKKDRGSVTIANKFRSSEEEFSGVQIDGEKSVVCTSHALIQTEKVAEFKLMMTVSMAR